ncbi:MAG TPA: hypothetical protein VNO54_17150 [Streptosporangiaceae bacterium]|nr:hypothetical protein [Streptosporangiaceae bacterium]
MGRHCGRQRRLCPPPSSSVLSGTTTPRLVRSELTGALLAASHAGQLHDLRELVTAVTALAAMLWQYAHPADSLRSLYEEDPRLAHAVVDFVPPAGQHDPEP